MAGPDEMAEAHGPATDVKAWIAAPASAAIPRRRSRRSGAMELAPPRAARAEMPAALAAQIEGRGIRHRSRHSRLQLSEELSTLPKFPEWPGRPRNAVWTDPVTGRAALLRGTPGPCAAPRTPSPDCASLRESDGLGARYA